VLADSDSQELPSQYQPYAALLLSKIYHYIGQDEEAVEFALRAGSAFEKEVQGEYRDTIIGESESPTSLTRKLTS
jgi:26S proteasome regulatory subunit N2